MSGRSRLRGFSWRLGLRCGLFHPVQLRIAVAEASAPRRLCHLRGGDPHHPPHQRRPARPDDGPGARDRPLGRGQRDADDRRRQPVPVTVLFPLIAAAHRWGFRATMATAAAVVVLLASPAVLVTAGRQRSPLPCRENPVQGDCSVSARRSFWWPVCCWVSHADGETDSCGGGIDRRDREPRRAANGPLEGHGARVRRHRPAFRRKPGDTGDSRDRQRSGLVVGRRAAARRFDRAAPRGRARSWQPGYVSVRPGLDGVARGPASRRWARRGHARSRRRANPRVAAGHSGGILRSRRPVSPGDGDRRRDTGRVDGSVSS